MNNKLNAEECDALKVYNDAAQRAHEKITVDTNSTSKKILTYVKYIGLVIITWFCSVQYDRYFGSVINDGINGSSPPKTSAITRAERKERKERERLARLHPYWKKYAIDAPYVSIIK